MDVLLALVVLVVVYDLLPDLFAHGLRWGVVSRGPRDRAQVALTFDDGPGPLTPAFLDELARQGARATFFVLGEAARGRPEIIARMVAEGHEVGSHGLRHHPAWLAGPGATRRLVAGGLRAIQGVTATPVRLYRPPWGQHNLLTGLMAKRSGLVTVLWSVAPGDWVAGRGAEEIVRRCERIRPGDIVLLHDAGGDGRERTLEALPRILASLNARGLEAVPLKELLRAHPPPRGLGATLWGIWEWAFSRIFRVDTVAPRSVLRVARVRYRGAPLRTEDGVALAPGQIAAEIHFANGPLASFGAQSPVRALRAVEAALGDLARFVAAHERYGDVEVFFGTTLLAGQAAARLGFTVTDLEGGSLQRRATRWYLAFIMAVFHVQGAARLAHRGGSLVPRTCAMSRATLMRRYGPDAARARRAPR